LNRKDKGIYLLNKGYFREQLTINSYHFNMLIKLKVIRYLADKSQKFGGGIWLESLGKSCRQFNK